MATLYLVSTPIGNLEDLSRRAERVLREAERIVAEDTRRTRVLLSHFGISKRLSSYHQHNEARRTGEILRWLEAGEDVALVSDAGTPLISDPGERVVRSAASAGHAVVPIPGPSAVTAALAASGLVATPFVFLGFVPKKGAQRRALLARIAGSRETAVVFESPDRLLRLLADLEEEAGSEREVAVAREMTKVHETIFRGTLAEASSYYGTGRIRGEITVIVAPAPAESGDAMDDAAMRDAARELLDTGSTPSRAAREISERLGIPRNRAYALVQEERRE